MGDETEFALNLGKDKDWYRSSIGQFEYWAGKAGVPWRAIKPHLLDTLERARDLWPEALRELPMHDNHKQGLREHWRRLSTDFRIESQ
jgi:serine/threonine-protein kinase HipA